MERRNSRVTKCRDVFGSRAPALHALESARALLGVGKRTTSDRERCRAGENSLPHGHLQWHFLTPIKLWSVPMPYQVKVWTEITVAQCSFTKVHQVTQTNGTEPYRRTPNVFGNQSEISGM